MLTKMSTLQSAIENIGLTDKQAKIYLANLELGPSSIQNIAEKAQIKRTTVYSVIESLLEQGLISKFSDEKGQKFQAKAPEALIKQLEQRQKNLKSILPQLQAITNIGDIKPEVRFYQGREGLRTVYEDTLQTKNEILSLASAEDIYQVLPDYIPKYLQKRIKKGIKMRAIVQDSLKARIHQKRDEKEFRQTKLVQDLNLTIEKNIYADKVALMSFRAYPMGIIIKSPQIAKSEKAIFELLWQYLK